MAYTWTAGDAAGFKPYGAVLRTTRYRKSSTGVIGAGDMLIAVASGFVRACVSTMGTKTYYSKVVGVAAHFVTGTAGVRDVWVYDHPDQRFSVNCSPTIAYSQLHSNHRITWTRGGDVAHCNRTLGLSKHILGIGATAASKNGVFRIEGYVEGDALNTTATAYNKVWGQINPIYHIYGGTGVAI